ncbi:DUF5719 family protein [Nocardiopsis sp. NPDC055824]
MRLIVENRFALFGLVALALAALFGVAFATRPVTAELGVTEPGAVRPDHAVRVCPAPHEEGDSTVAAFAPRVGRDDEGELWAESVPAAPEEDGDAEDGSGSGDAEDAAGRDLLGDELTEPGRVWSADASDASGPTAVRAEGSLASGLDAAQTTLSGGSVTEVRCVEPSIGTWFALPGAGGGEAVEVDAITALLANPEDSRATVSVDVYTEGGPSYSSESRGISLLAGESTELDLTELVRSTGAVGVHVRTSTGRVAASLLAEHASGGADWVPPTAAPAVHHVVPGILGGDGRRHLVLAAPGDEPAEVRVHAVASSGDGGEEDASGVGGSGTAEDPLVVAVPPAAAAWVTLESVLGGEAGAVVVESDVPVVAGVAAEAMDGDDVVETAYTSAVPPLGPPLDATAVLPDVPEGTDTELVLSAVEGDASLMATPVTADGTQGDAVRVAVAAGTTVVFGAEEDPWEAPPGADPEDGYAVRLELLEGSSLHVARVLRDGDGVSVLPVRPAPVEIPLPVVRDSMVGIVP